MKRTMVLCQKCNSYYTDVIDDDYKIINIWENWNIAYTSKDCVDGFLQFQLDKIISSINFDTQMNVLKENNISIDKYIEKNVYIKCNSCNSTSEKDFSIYILSEFRRYLFNYLVSELDDIFIKSIGITFREFCTDRLKIDWLMDREINELYKSNKKKYLYIKNSYDLWSSIDEVGGFGGELGPFDDFVYELGLSLAVSIITYACNKGKKHLIEYYNEKKIKNYVKNQIKSGNYDFSKVPFQEMVKVFELPKNIKEKNKMKIIDSISQNYANSIAEELLKKINSNT